MLGDEIMMAQKLLDETYVEAKELSVPVYLGFVSMLLEEKCKDEGLDVVDAMARMTRSAKNIVDKYGRY